MKTDASPSAEDKAFAPENFDVLNLEDEIAADQLCARFLQNYFRHLVETENIPTVEAARLARGADHFLREFIIPEMRDNIFAISSNRVRQFAGNWYIIKTLEPNAKELGDILDGVKSFYRYCLETARVDPPRYEAILRECDQLEYYRQRIDSFWDIEGDGFFAWDADCPLK